MPKPPNLEYDLEAAFAVFGLRLMNVSDRYPYKERKGKTYAVFDGDKILCSYATLQQIRQWAKERLTQPKT